MEGKKTALVLSGGGALGAYEIGAFKALTTVLGMRFDIITGTSIGAMNAYVLVQDKLQEAEELWLTLTTNQVFDREHMIENRGVKFTGIKDVLRERFHEEDARNSRTELGLVTVRLPKLDPIYLWAKDCPQGEMLDYVLASCTCFPIVAPYEIGKEKFVDGGFFDYIPVSMALDRGADEIVAIDLKAVGVTQKDAMKAAGRKLTVIRSEWDLGNFAEFDPDNAKLIMRLGYLDTLKTYGRYEGFRMTFEPGAFSWREWEAADEAAEIFGLSGSLVYTRESFLQALRHALITIRRKGGSARQKAFLALCKGLQDDPQRAARLQAFGRRITATGLDSAGLDAAGWMIQNGLIG